MANVIILGGGPAGVSAALYTVRAGISTTIIAKDIGALQKAELVENYYGLGQPLSGRQIHENGIAQATRLGVQILHEEAVGLSFLEKLTVKTQANTYEADCVILATGSARKAPKINELPRFEGKGVSYCAVCDAFFYRGAAVCVLGHADYARNEVQELLPVAGSVTVLTNGAEPTADFPAGVAVIQTPIAELTGDEKLAGVTFADGSTLAVQGLFIAQGTAGSADLARKIGAVVENNKIVVDANMATSVPGLFAAGDCTGGMLQVAKAVYEGAMAGSQAVKYIRAQKG